MENPGPITRFRKWASNVLAPGTPAPPAGQSKNLEPEQQADLQQFKKTVSHHARTVAHKLQTLFNDCANYESNNPRDRMKLARLIIRNIPMLQRAVNLTADFVGSVEFYTDNEQLQEVLDKFATSVPIRFQDNPDYPYFFGLDNYVKVRVKTALTDGMAFSEEYYSGENMTEWEGLVVMKTESFNFEKDGNRMVLKFYPANGQPITIDPAAPGFDVFGVHFMPGSLWGLSMVDGGQFFAEMLVHMLVARKNAWINHGNPLEMLLFSLSNYSDFKPKDWELFHEQTDKIAEKLVDGLRNVEKGKRALVDGVLPGDVTMQNTGYGTNSRPLSGFSDDVEMVLRQLAALTGLPIELLGFDTGGDGFSGEKFRVLYRLLRGTIKAIHGLEIPRLKKRCDNYLLAMGYPPAWLDQYTVGFSEPDFDSEKEVAETDKTIAETIQMHFANLETLWFSLGLGDVNLLNDYLENVGLDWLQLKAPPTPAQPE